MAGIIGIGNAPCSWGILEFNVEGKTPGYEQVLDEMVASEYAGTELGLWGFMPTETDELKPFLESRNLALLGAFLPVALGNDEALHPGRQAALKIARLLSAIGGET
ncbi:MAG: xylose isomerase, partial [Phycisphaerales bacterium]